MIIYEGTKDQFVQEAFDSTLSLRLLRKFQELGIHGGGHAEQESWKQSLTRVASILDNEDIPGLAQVALEYRIPTTGKRIDFMISGQDEKGKDNVYLLELKQWETAELSNYENCVRTFVGGANRYVQHPCAQIYNYAMLLKNLNQEIQDGDISLYPAAYLHNYKEEDRKNLTDSRYEFYLKHVPLYLSSAMDRHALRNDIKRHIVKPSSKDLFRIIEHGKLKPSKSLQESILSLLEGNQEFYMLDEQQVAYSAILSYVQKASKQPGKTVILIQGGPGTGKSVIAVSLLAELIHQGYSASYVTKNAAPRNVFATELTRGHKSKAYIKNLFKSSQGFVNEAKDRYDCLLVDEAHRLGDRSTFFDKSGIDQARRIIHASKVTAFFLDEEQRITTKDRGSLAQLRKDAEMEGARVIESPDLILHSQFRCNGSDGFIAWIDNALGIRETANEQFDLDYDLRVYSDPNKMRDDLRKLNQINNKARMLAGYTYEWNSSKPGHEKDSDIVLKNGFEAQWNFSGTSTWAIDPDSFEQVGCIYTSQGLEFDYCGVIIGLDLRYEGGKVIADPTKNAKSDKSTFSPQSLKKGPSPLGDMIIKNTYKTLLTRGQKGCFIFCEDQNLADYLVKLGAKKV